MSEIFECPGRSAYSDAVINAAGRVTDASFLKNARVLITGASGLVGGALCRTLLYLSRTRSLNLTLVLPLRKEPDGRLSGIAGRSEVSFCSYLTNGKPEYDGETDYIVHCAAATASKELGTRPYESLASAARGTLALIDFAIEKRVRGMVYLSSMEAYGVKSGETREGEEGVIDLASPRSGYPESKRFCELACLCAAREHNLPVCSARLAQTFGAGINPGENRAFAAFARAALKGEDIVLHTKGESVGNYVGISDCVSALITLLEKGAAGETYNVCGDSCHMTIKQLAALAGEVLSGGKSKVVTDIPSTPLPYAPDTQIILLNDKLKALGWQPVMTPAQMLESLGRDMTENGLPG